MGLRISAGGLQAAADQFAVSANNTANLLTPGFRSRRAEQEALPGGGVRVSGTNLSTQAGPLTTTGLPLNAAIVGDGFFALRGADGSEAFTRAGSFTLNAEGQLVTTGGELVQPGITIPPGTNAIQIGSDGSVSGVVPGEETPQAFGRIELVEFANAAGLQELGGNRFAATASSGAPRSTGLPDEGRAAIVGGFIEGGNVELAREAVDQLQSVRAFQANAGVFRAQDEILGTVIDLLR